MKTKKNIAMVQKQYHLTTEYWYIAHLYYAHNYIYFN